MINSIEFDVSHPLRVRADRIAVLLQHSKLGFRLYELSIISRPGDLIYYLDVEPVDQNFDLLGELDPFPSSRADFIEQTGDSVSLNHVFACIHGRNEDRSDYAIECRDWLDGPRFRDFLNELLACVHQHLQHIIAQDEFIAYLFRRFELSAHSSCFKSRRAIVYESVQTIPDVTELQDEAIQHVTKILQDPRVDSIALIGDQIDARLMKIACAEQRQRAEQSNQQTKQVLRIRVLGERGVRPPEEWDSSVEVQAEGIPIASVWIDCRTDDQSFYFKNSKRPAHTVLMLNDLGEVPGYTSVQQGVWWIYRKETVDAVGANYSLQMGKLEKYRQLVLERKSCSRCPPLNNAGAGVLRRFDGFDIGPWTRWHGDLNAHLMIVGQDWGGARTYLAQEGRDVNSPTNQNLVELLGHIGIAVDGPDAARNHGGLFLTNSVLCLKDGPDNGHVPAGCFRTCGKLFLRPTIETVQPKVVVCLGYEAYRACSIAFGLRPVGTMSAAIEIPFVPIPEMNTVLVPVFHCGGLGLANRGIDLQRDDWQRVRRALDR